LHAQSVRQTELALLLILTFVLLPVSLGQKRGRPNRKPVPETELAKLREDFIKATREYKASLERLIQSHQGSLERAELRVAQSKELFAQGLVSKVQLSESETALAVIQDKVNEAKQQLANADTQIATTLLEAEAERKIAKLRLPRGALVATTSYIRFNGSANWLLPESGKVQKFFSDTFHKPLPIAVFGQGPIHDRWRLDHRNAMDVSLHPDGVEGRALIDFLRKNGIPFLAFRGAIPGTSTGPHIHIGRPSHRF